MYINQQHTKIYFTLCFSLANVSENFNISSLAKCAYLDLDRLLKEKQIFVAKQCCVRAHVNMLLACFKCSNSFSSSFAYFFFVCFAT